jgi:large subunit ribosomal protein L19
MDKFTDFEKTFERKEPLPSFAVGDTVDVQVLIKEGDKERVQVFNGTVIARRGRGLGSTFTVRRLVQGEGVERTFPTHSPKVVGLVVKARARVRRAKLYYLRERAGKSTRLRERIE